jgi:CelD/BcsL family acetyltransferase involved in cellulose biosynthesis
VLRIERLSEPPSAWAELCRNDPRATLFTHPRWMEAVLRAFPGHRPLYLVAVDGDRAQGLIPLVRRRRLGLDQILSLPFGTHGGPLVAPNAGPDTVPALARAFRELVSGIRVMRFEMTVFNPGAALEEGLAGELGGWARRMTTHLIDLTPGFDHLWDERYDRNTRNCVRMSERAGVTAAEETGPEALAVLHRLHEAQARDWTGIHAFSLDALRGVCDTLGTDARIYVARREGKPLMACLFLEHEGREIRPWVSGTDPDARPVRASHLLYNHALRDACGRGRRVWDFGGSGGNQGIEFFKQSFGATPAPVVRFFHVAGWVRRVRRVPAWD